MANERQAYKTIYVGEVNGIRRQTAYSNIAGRAEERETK